MPSNTTDTHTLWFELAELFFTGEPDEQDLERVANILKAAHWDKGRTKAVLEDLIAPIAGYIFGPFQLPVLGDEWMGFDKEFLCLKIELLQEARQKYPKWYFYLQDKTARRVMRKLHMNRLLEKLG